MIYNIYQILEKCGLDTTTKGYHQRKIQRLAKAGIIGIRIIKEYAFTEKDVLKIKKLFKNNCKKT
jgi:hypothetical protein